MKITGNTDPPAVVSSKLWRFTPDSDLLQKPISRKQVNRKSRSAGGGRSKREGAPAAGKRGSRPETPLLRWKFDEGNYVEVESEKSSDVSQRSGRNPRKGRDLAAVSARRLAAGLWRFQRPEVRVDSGVSGFQHKIDHPGIHSSAMSPFDTQADEVRESRNSVSTSRNTFLHELDPRFRGFNSAMEGATKWDPGSRNEPEDMKRVHGRSNREQVGAVSTVSAVESELERARTRVRELETERQSSKTRLEQFLNQLNEERAVWRRREHEKIRAVVDDVGNELSREQKERQRAEKLNSKLMGELENARAAAKRYMRGYEKERKTRELVEGVCDELAQEIGDDKAEVEEWKRESVKMREEVDDERNMLQMAEVWREERVQMKLVDAKLALENKYSEMNRLVADLEAFLNSKTTNLDPVETRRTDALRQSAASVNIRETGEFLYEPPNPDDESGWETVSHAEDQGSSHSPNGSGPSLTDGRIPSPPTKQPKKASALSRLWKSSHANKGGNHKIASAEGMNGMFSDCSGLSRSDSGEPWSSPDSNGRTERATGTVQTSSLKSRLFEAQMGGQKIRLRQVLKQNT